MYHMYHMYHIKYMALSFHVSLFVSPSRDILASQMFEVWDALDVAGLESAFPDSFG